MIMQRLLCAPMVEYIWLYRSDTLKPFEFSVHLSGEQPSQLKLLSTPEWSDPPHFARVATYRDRVWPLSRSRRESGGSFLRLPSQCSTYGRRAPIPRGACGRSPPIVICSTRDTISARYSTYVSQLV